MYQTDEKPLAKHHSQQCESSSLSQCRTPAKRPLLNIACGSFKGERMTRSKMPVGKKTPISFVLKLRLV